MEPSSSSPVAALADAVRRRRRQLGLRQDEVADLAGVSERFVHTVEAGKETLQVDKVVAVLVALGLRLRIERGRGGVVADD